jgi:hypothetical protein
VGVGDRGTHTVCVREVGAGEEGRVEEGDPPVRPADRHVWLLGPGGGTCTADSGQIDLVRGWLNLAPAQRRLGRSPVARPGGHAVSGQSRSSGAQAQGLRRVDADAT